YLNSKNIYFELVYAESIVYKSSSLENYAYKIKDKLANFANIYLPGKSSVLFNGIVFGAKERIDERTKDSLIITGTSHATSASGFNVLAIYIFIKASLKFLNKKPKILITLFLVNSYLLIIGLYILPALRATITLNYILLSELLGRKPNVWIGISISIF